MARHEVDVLMADRWAELIDRASAAGDGDMLARFAVRLSATLDRLPIEPADAVGGGSPHVGSSGRDGKLLELVDGPPTLGDAADAG